MDLSNIELNRPYKPREICTLLNRSMPDSTYQRRKLYEDLSTLFVWHKQGYSIVVDEIISDTPANVRKATIEKKLPFTACIDMISNTLPKEFSDEDLFRAIFNSTFEELTDVSSYTDYDSKTLYNFMWCLRNKIYSKYHTALVQINKRQRLGIGFLNTITGEIGYNSEYSQTWQTIVYDKYDYSSYMKAVTSLCGSIPIYRYKDTDGGVVSHDVYMNIYKHLYDYIYKSFVTTASNESKAKKLVRLWGKDKFKLTFDAPKTNRPKKERKAQDTISTRLKFTDCMRYRIDKYLRENNKSSLTYDDICKALFGDTISDLIKFDYKYTKHAYKRINPETREVTEYKTHGN